MIYFFSSNFYKLYEKDVLDACCYPEGHVMRLRYSEKFVPECVRNSPATWLGHEGLIIFADKEGTGESATDFAFYPIREAKIVNIQLLAGILFVDAMLGNFVNYGAEDDKIKEKQWDQAIKQLPERPHSPGSVNEGYFLYVLRDGGIAYSTEESGDQLAWRSVIERINRSALAECLTFRVLGFYRVRNRLIAGIEKWSEQATHRVRLGKGWKRRLIRPLGFVSRLSASKIPPKVSATKCMYEMPMGKLVILKLLFYRSGKAPMNRILKISLSGHTFSSTSVDRIAVQYRYNHETVFLACNRVTVSAAAKKWSTLAVECGPVWWLRSVVSR